MAESPDLNVGMKINEASADHTARMIAATPRTLRLTGRTWTAEESS
jgi:hypothetical protein